MRIEISEHEKKVLSNVGHGAYGRDLVAIMRKVKAQVCSLEGIEPGGDHNAEVEGRLLFKTFADEILKYLELEFRRKDGPPREGRADFS